MNRRIQLESFRSVGFFYKISTCFDFYCVSVSILIGSKGSDTVVTSLIRIDTIGRTCQRIAVVILCDGSVRWYFLDSRFFFILDTSVNGVSRIHFSMTAIYIPDFIKVVIDSSDTLIPSMVDGLVLTDDSSMDSFTRTVKENQHITRLDNASVEIAVELWIAASAGDGCSCRAAIAGDIGCSTSHVHT